MAQDDDKGDEKLRLKELYREPLKLRGSELRPDDRKKLKTYTAEATRHEKTQRTRTKRP